jgi:hypothetical protein
MQRFFGVDGRQTRSAGGFDRVAYHYRADGRIDYIWEMGYDAANLGYASVRVVWDDRGNDVERTLGGPDRVRVALYGVWGKRITRDAAGHVTQYTALNLAGEPIVTETFVRKVIDGGAAAALGLHIGDVFVRYDGEAITHSGNFILRRDAEPATGPNRELEVRREGQTLRFAIRPGKLQVILSDRAMDWTEPTAVAPPSTAPASAPASAPPAPGR